MQWSLEWNAGWHAFAAPEVVAAPRDPLERFAVRWSARHKPEAPAKDQRQPSLALQACGVRQQPSLALQACGVRQCRDDYKPEAPPAKDRRQPSLALQACGVRERRSQQALRAAEAWHPAARLSRPGFTLLEMLLATVISTLLMGALYVAMDVQIRHAQIGRDVIEQGTLAHSLLAKITRDIKQCVTPATAVLPTPLTTLSKDVSTPAAGAPSATPNAGSTDSGSANASSSPGSANSSASSGASSPSLLPTRDTIQFQLGVQGGPTTLTLYVSKLPTEGRPPTGVRSDLRLVSYWLATDGSRPLGLAWREFEQVTAEEANSTSAATNGAMEGAEIIAPEVVSLQFRYFDGTTWLENWDGSQTGPDYLTPVGPPLAIEITLGILVLSSDNHSGGQPNVRYYRHVVPILTAEGVARSST